MHISHKNNAVKRRKPIFHFPTLIGHRHFMRKRFIFQKLHSHKKNTKEIISFQQLRG